MERFVYSFTHLFLPHESNNHRAKVLHIDSLAVYALFFALFYLGTSFFHQQVPDILGYATDIYADQLLTATNARRAASGLSPLSLNGQLAAAAAAKAQDMFTNNYWAHNSPEGKSPWDFIVSSGYRYSVAGENLAKNFMTSSAVVDAWMASPSHRDNVLKPSYREVGFAVVNGKLNGEETTLVVQMFGTQLGSGPIGAQKVAAAEPSAAIPTQILAQGIVSITPTTTVVQVPSENQQPLSTVIPVNGSTQDNTSKQNLVQSYQGVSQQPVVNLGVVNKTVVWAFIGGLLAVLAFDAYLVYQKRIVRVTGHNVAHFLFFAALLVVSTLVTRGSVL